VVEALDSLHQADVALLDEVDQRKPAAVVTASDRNHQTQIRGDEAVLSPLLRLLCDAHLLEVPLERRGHADVITDDVTLVREVAGETVHRAVRLLDEETVAIELAHLGRELETKVVPADFLALAELVGLRALTELAE
jgi:hypothetical protein